MAIWRFCASPKTLPPQKKSHMLNLRGVAKEHDRQIVIAIGPPAHRPPPPVPRTLYESIARSNPSRTEKNEIGDKIQCTGNVVSFNDGSTKPKHMYATPKKKCTAHRQNQPSRQSSSPTRISRRTQELRSFKISESAYHRVYHFNKSMPGRIMVVACHLFTILFFRSTIKSRPTVD